MAGLILVVNVATVEVVWKSLNRARTSKIKQIDLFLYGAVNPMKIHLFPKTSKGFRNGKVNFARNV